MTTIESKAPETLTLPAIGLAAARLRPYVRETPVWEFRDPLIETLVGPGTSTVMKLELFQESGTFKARGAVLNVLALSGAQRAVGVTAVSAGNHAAAVAYAAQRLHTSAKVVVPTSVSPARFSLCQRLGAEIVLAEDVGDAFAKGRQIEQGEGRAMIHPFDGPVTMLATATLGLEFARQA